MNDLPFSGRDVIMLIVFAGLCVLTVWWAELRPPKTPRAECRFCHGSGTIFEKDVLEGAWTICPNCKGAGTNAHEFVWSESMQIWYCVNCTAHCNAGEPAPEPPCLWVRS